MSTSSKTYRVAIIGCGPRGNAAANGYGAHARTSVVGEGRIGRMHHIEGNCKGYYGGYGLMDIGCHLINNLVKFGGHCRSVMAFAQTGGHPITPADAVTSPEGMGVITGEDLTAMIQLDSGVTATLIHHRLPNVG